MRPKNLDQRTKNSYKEDDRVLHYQKLPFIPKIIWIKLISRYHDDFLIGHFSINKTKEFFGQKYYWPSLQRDIEAYVKGCDVCLTSKAVKHKPYGNFQSLFIPTHQWKDLTIDFVIGLPISTNWKGDSYDSILVIINQLTKMVHYEPVRVTINVPGLAKVMIDVVI